MLTSELELAGHQRNEGLTRPDTPPSCRPMAGHSLGRPQRRHSDAVLDLLRRIRSRPRAYPEETPEQRAVKYECYTSFFVPCAKAQGVEFLQEPPSKEAWIASFDDAHSGAAWSPAARNRFVDGSETARNLYAACPALPLAQYYYGQ